MAIRNEKVINETLDDIDVLLDSINSTIKRTDYKLLNLTNEHNILKQRKRSYSTFELDTFYNDKKISIIDGKLCVEADPQQGIAFDGIEYSQGFAIPKQITANFEIKKIAFISQNFPTYVGNMSTYDATHNCIWMIKPVDSISSEIIKIRPLNNSDIEILARWQLLNLDNDGYWNGIEYDPTIEFLFITYSSTSGANNHLCQLRTYDLYLGVNDIPAGQTLNPGLSFAEFSLDVAIDPNFKLHDIVMFDINNIGIIYQNKTNGVIGCYCKKTADLTDSVVPYVNGLEKFIFPSSSELMSGTMNGAYLYLKTTGSTNKFFVFDTMALIANSFATCMTESTFIANQLDNKAAYGLSIYQNDLVDGINLDSKNYFITRTLSTTLYEGQTTTIFPVNANVIVASEYIANYVLYITKSVNYEIHLWDEFTRTEQTCIISGLNILDIDGCYWSTVDSALFVLLKYRTSNNIERYAIVSIAYADLFSAPTTLNASINIASPTFIKQMTIKYGGLSYDNGFLYSFNYDTFHVEQINLSGVTVSDFDSFIPSTMQNVIVSFAFLGGILFVMANNLTYTIIHENEKHAYILPQNARCLFRYNSKIYCAYQTLIKCVETLANINVMQQNTYLTSETLLASNDVSAFSNIIEKTFASTMYTTTIQIDHYYGIVGYSNVAFGGVACELLNFDNYLCIDNDRYNVHDIPTFRFINNVDNAIYVEKGIRDIVVEKDLIFMTSKFTPPASTYFSLFIINVINDTILGISNKGIYKYNGTIAQSNDGLGYTKVSSIGILNQDIMMINAVSFSKNDITDFNEDCPQSFVMLSTASGVSLININWEGAEPKIVGTHNNIFGAKQVNQYALYVAASGNIFFCDSDFNLYTTDKAVWEFQKSAAVSFIKIMTLPTLIMNIAKSSICFRDSQQRWRHLLFVGCADSNSNVYGLAMLDAEQSTLDWIYQKQWDKNVNTAAFLSPVIFEDKIFAIDVGLPVTKNYVSKSYALQKVANYNEFLDASSLALTQNYLKYSFKTFSLLSMLYNVQYHLPLNVLSFISSEGLHFVHTKYQNYSELVSVEQTMAQPFLFAHYNKQLVDDSFQHLELLSKDDANATYINGSTQNWNIDVEYNWIVSDPGGQGMLHFICDAMGVGADLWLRYGPNGAKVKVEVFNRTTMIVEETRIINTYSPFEYYFNSRYIFTTPLTSAYRLRVYHNGNEDIRATLPSIAAIRQFSRIYDVVAGSIQPYARLSHSMFPGEYQDSPLFIGVNAPYYDVQIVADGINNVYAMPATNHAFEFISASADDGATWTDQTLLTWGSNVPLYNDKIVNAIGQFSVDLGSVPPFGNIIRFKIIPMADTFQAAFKWEFPKYPAYPATPTYVNTRLYMRLLEYITEVFPEENNPFMDNIAYTNISNNFRVKQVFLHGIELLKEPVPGPAPAGRKDIFLDQADNTLKEIDEFGNVKPLSGGGGAADIYDEGILVASGITGLNFVGSGIVAVNPGFSPTIPNIYVPPPAFVSHYNTTDGIGNATVSDITTYNRYVAAPTVEGTPYKIGGWVGGTSHSCIQNGAISYQPGNNFSVFNNTTTDITATVYDADGVTPIATHMHIITGNGTSTASNITITITSFGPNTGKFQCMAQVQFNMAAILPAGGRFSIRITHTDDVDGAFTKTQNDIFYDINNNAATLAGGTTSITETGGSVVTRFISGVEYYYLGSQFTIDVSDIDWINCNSYPSIVLDCNGTEYGLPTLNETVAALTGWTNLWNDINDSYQKTNWAISAANFFTMTTTANVSARVEDWAAGAWQNSADNAILIDTHNAVSTDTIERFYYENYRCALVGPNFDLPNQKAWISSNDLLNADACFFNGGCEHNQVDFTPYDPNAASQPNYNIGGRAGTQTLIRETITDGLSHSAARINITGTYTTLEVKLAKAWDGLVTGGSVWLNCLSDYDPGQFNNGNPAGGTGCRSGSGAGYVDITLGNLNTANCSHTLYIRVGFASGQRITALSINFV